MILQNLMMQATVLAAFVLLFIVIPYLCMGLKLTYENFVYNILCSFTVGAFFVIIIVFILMGIRQLNALAVYISFIFSALLLPTFFYNERASKRVHDLITHIFLLIRGVYKLKLVTRAFIKEKMIAIFYFVKGLFKNPLRSVSILVGIGAAFYVRCYNQITQMYFGTSDLYVHTEWIAQMIDGKIFANGVYPFGMHNMIFALHKVTGINLVTLMQFSGSIIGILIVLSLYLLLTKLFKSQLAISIGFLTYTLSRYVEQRAYERQAFTLPQELAMVFLFLCGIFLVDYLRGKKNKDLFLFFMSLSLTIACHFYITIFAVLLILCIIIVHFKEIILKKMFFKIILVSILSTVVGVFPLMAFNLSGIPWEPSMEWATSLMSASKSNSSEEAFPEVIYGENSGFFEKIFISLNTVAENFSRYERNNTEQRRAIYWLLLGSAIFLVLVSLIFIILKKEVEYAKFLLAMGLYSLMVFVLIYIQVLGILTFFEERRLVIFYFYNIGFLLGFLAEFIMIPFTYIKPLKKVGAVFMTGLFSVFLWYSFNLGIQYPGRFVQSQYNGAVISYYNIVKNYPKQKWTIVSSVDEISMVRNIGWHHELSTLVYKLAEPENKINIPTQDVFFFIEKRPIETNRMNYADNPNFSFPPEMSVSESLAGQSIKEIQEKLSIPSAIYTNIEYRRVVMSKVYYWILEYMKYFPNEMSVFYEDDDIVVYHLTQPQMYALNNLQIDYGYNN